LTKSSRWTMTSIRYMKPKLWITRNFNIFDL
jgi:hypothetical protein